MNVCVVGGAGKMAEAAIRDLIESDDVEAIASPRPARGPPTTLAF